jgi:DNA uptake protein ComE-like DNA-binding protein
MVPLHALLKQRGRTDEALAELYRSLFIPINLNTATAEEILLIPGLGNRMLHEFEEYRPYVAMAQFRREMGKYVDAAEVARLEQYVFVPIDLNTATDEDILSIPGMGPRMLREFKEYRPYTSIEQFRREIGKYVDAKELSRLERYVTIK